MSKNFPTDKDIIIDDLDGQYVLNLTDEEHGRLRKMTAADLFLVTMIVARAVKSRLALPDDDDSEVTALTVKVGEMEREQARIVEAHRNVILNLTNAIEAEEVVHRDVILNLTNGIEAELKERDAEVARLKEALDGAQTLIRSAAPLSWAAGTSREQDAYEWEKRSDVVLNAIDLASTTPSAPVAGRSASDDACPKCGKRIGSVGHLYSECGWTAEREPGATEEGPGALDVLGRMVREVWIAWAREQPLTKPSWVVPWEELSEPDKDVDRRIGVAIAEHARAAVVAEIVAELREEHERCFRQQHAVDKSAAELADAIETKWGAKR